MEWAGGLSLLSLEVDEARLTVVAAAWGSRGKEVYTDLTLGRDDIDGYAMAQTAPPPKTLTPAHGTPWTRAATGDLTCTLEE